MKDFNEIRNTELPIFESATVENLTDDERKQAEEIYMKLKMYLGEHKLTDIDEGILGSIIGGVAGFIAGPALGKTIANALGIDHGILYDMFTSRLVVAALGSALGKKL
jgi:hypothetical protein